MSKINLQTLGFSAKFAEEAASFGCFPVGRVSAQYKDLYRVITETGEVLAEVSEHGLFNQARFEPNGYNTSDSVQIWLFTQMLLYFFEAYPQFDNQRGKSGDTPKSKLLFISKLVYFTKLTRNEAYNDNDDNIKKIIKKKHILIKLFLL